jgi:hypothetical protein
MSNTRRKPTAAPAPEPTPPPAEKPPYQKLIDRYKEINIEELLGDCEAQTLEKKTAHEAAELELSLEKASTDLKSLQTDAEIQMTKDFNCKVDKLPKILQKEYTDSRTMQRYFSNEEEYNVFRKFYVLIKTKMPEIDPALRKASSSLAKKKLEEDEAKKKAQEDNSKQNEDNESDSVFWLTEDLAQYIAAQFKALSGNSCCNESKEHELISVLSSDDVSPNEKEQETETYLTDNRPGLLRNILISLKKASQADRTNHWLENLDDVDQIAIQFNPRTAATFFKVFTPKSTLKTVAFFTSDADLQDKQTVADYYLKRFPKTRLGEIIQNKKRQLQKEVKSHKHGNN